MRQGSYLGHPNKIRASVDNDPRQCKWEDPNGPSDADFTTGFTAPLAIAASSSGAIIEFESDAFGGQLRGNLIWSQYGARLQRLILRPDGLGVIPQSNPPLKLTGENNEHIGDKGLGLTQAPDGSLVEVRFPANVLWVHEPDEPATTDLTVRAVFPRRGGQAGGSTLTIYGVNLNKNGNPTVTVGGSACPVTSVAAKKIKCTLPGGSGTVDVIVTSGADSYTYLRGYRFVAGAR